MDHKNIKKTPLFLQYCAKALGCSENNVWKQHMLYYSMASRYRLNVQHFSNMLHHDLSFAQYFKNVANPNKKLFWEHL